MMITERGVLGRHPRGRLTLPVNGFVRGPRTLLICHGHFVPARQPASRVYHSIVWSDGPLGGVRSVAGRPNGGPTGGSATRKPARAVKSNVTQCVHRPRMRSNARLRRVGVARAIR